MDEIGAASDEVVGLVSCFLSRGCPLKRWTAFSCCVVCLCVACDGAPSPDSAAARAEAVAPAASRALVLVPTPVEVTWFEGAAHLPDGHPCRDDAPLVVATYSSSAWALSVKTMGQGTSGRRGSDALPWSERGEWRIVCPHLGARSVRGVRWRDAGGDHVVASCAVRGLGLTRRDYPAATRYRGVPFPMGARSPGTQLVIDAARCPGEHSGAYASVIAMRRAKGQDHWAIVSEHDIFDQVTGGAIHAASYMQIYRAQTHPHDGHVTIAAFGLDRCRLVNKKEDLYDCLDRRRLEDNPSPPGPFLASLYVIRDDAPVLKEDVVVDCEARPKASKRDVRYTEAQVGVLERERAAFLREVQEYVRRERCVGGVPR